MQCAAYYNTECMGSVLIEILKGVFKIMDKDTIVGTVYPPPPPPPPGTNLDKFHNRMQEVIIRIQKENKKAYIVGDYNINLVHYDMHTAIAECILI